MFKKLLVIGAVVTFALVVWGCGGELPKGAVAQVGETVITQEQFDQRVADITAQLQGQAPDKEQDPEGYKLFEQRILDYMVTLEIVTQKQAELGVNITDEDLQTQLDQIKQMFGGDEAKFADALEQQKITLDQLKQNLRERSLMTKAAEEVTKDVAVSDEEIAAYYDEHTSDFEQDETRTARHILIAPSDPSDTSTQPTDAQWQAALTEAQQVRKEIVEGADFGEKAKEVSDDPGSKELGGDLGVVQKGMMVPEFDQALFSLEDGQISEPVKTQYGYHIIQVTQINPAKQQTLDEVKEQIKSQLLDQAQQKAWEAWVADMKSQLNVVIGEGLELTTTTTATGGESTSTTAGGGDASTTETTAGGGDASTTETTAGGATTTAS